MAMRMTWGKKIQMTLRDHDGQSAPDKVAAIAAQIGKQRPERGKHAVFYSKCLGRRAQQQISSGEAEEQVRRPGRQQRGQKVNVCPGLER